MPCPYLKEVVMLYCDAYRIKKMVPLDRLVSASPCLAQEFAGCPLFREAAPCASTDPAASPDPTCPSARREALR